MQHVQQRCLLQRRAEVSCAKEQFSGTEVWCQLIATQMPTSLLTRAAAYMGKETDLQIWPELTNVVLHTHISRSCPPLSGASCRTIDLVAPKYTLEAKAGLPFA